MMFQKLTFLGVLSVMILATSPVLRAATQAPQAVKKADVTSTARKTLEELISKQDYQLAFRKMKADGNKASDEEIIKFLLTSNGYKGWDNLSPANKKWVIRKIANKS
ncbi:MAG: hypothetical protein JSR85_02945 [Proteobacteria bacterium]|nr:hypothetical protein [Pseudomonadota bacterium]